VRVEGSRSWQINYARAHIRVRRGCYRYLVWGAGNKKLEFYLGKVKDSTPQASSPAPAAAGAPARSARGVRKSRRKR
jgi:hypothetical protein